MHNTFSYLWRSALKTIFSKHTDYRPAKKDCLANSANLTWPILSDSTQQTRFLYMDNVNDQIGPHSMLAAADLSCADLQGVNLYEADLRGAKLSDTNLSGADLAGGEHESR